MFIVDGDDVFVLQAEVMDIKSRLEALALSGNKLILYSEIARIIIITNKHVTPKIKNRTNIYLSE